MEDGLDVEVLRLKRLLHENLLKVEKENLELIRNGISDNSARSTNFQIPENKQKVPSTSSFWNSSQKTAKSSGRRSQPVTINVKSCPHVKLPPCKIHSDTEISRNPHSRIHFLNNLEYSLEMKSLERRVLQNEAKSVYFPCAVPLSPPIRIRREENALTSEPFQNHPASFTVPSNFYTPPVVKKKLDVQPGVSTIDENVVASSYKIAQKVEKNETAPQMLLSQPVLKKVSAEFSNVPAKVRFKSPEASHAFEDLDCNFSSSISQSVHENPQVPKEKNSQVGDNESHGFNLHISLDSCSTKDAIDKILQKLPDFFNRNQGDVCDASTKNSDLSNEKATEKMLQFKQENQKRTPPKEFFIPTQIVSTSMQTDPVVEKSNNQPILHDLVREIVLDTLKDIHLPVINCIANPVPISQKVDSGIQSEVENDVTDFEKILVNPGKGVLSNEGNNLAIRQDSLVSKGIQISLDSSQVPIKQPIYEEIYKTENSQTDTSKGIQVSLDSSHVPAKQPIYEEIYKTENSQASIEASNDNMIEQMTSLPCKSQKVESMLEKIYDHICKGKEKRDNYTNVPYKHSFLTREVAVQFNPLHTSTKSTITSEIKTADSYCQYEIPSTQKTFANASVQPENNTNSYKEHHTLQVNTYTQCETKSFFNANVQTEFLNYECAATNTSVCSTPVSDSMFMDDLLSEGEIPLPWNLRLLSLSDKSGGLNMNNTDSSDISIKDKDYSLSEGEIHPNITRYLNVYQHNPEGIDRQHDTLLSGLESDSRMQNTSKSDSEEYSSHGLMHGHTNTNCRSNSSLSEGEINLNASLSQGEVSPGFRFPVADSSRKCASHPSHCCNQGCGNLSCDQSVIHSQIGDILSHSLRCNCVPENKSRRESGNGESLHNYQQYAPHAVLHSVDEETHAMFD